MDKSPIIFTSRFSFKWGSLKAINIGRTFTTKPNADAKIAKANTIEL